MGNKGSKVFARIVYQQGLDSYLLHDILVYLGDYKQHEAAAALWKQQHQHVMSADEILAPQVCGQDGARGRGNVRRGRGAARCYDRARPCLRRRQGLPLHGCRRWGRGLSSSLPLFARDHLALFSSFLDHVDYDLAAKKCIDTKVRGLAGRALQNQVSMAGSIYR